MLTQRAPRTVVSEVFDDMKPMVDKIATRFAIRYNQDKDDCRSVAYCAFLEAYHSFRPELCTRLEQRLSAMVWNRLLDALDKNLRRDKNIPRADADFDFIESRDPEPFDRDGFCSELTDDAKTVVSLLFDTPGELLDMIRREKPSQENPGAPIRRCLSRYIRCTVGWAASRIASAFAELEEAVA